MHNEANLLCHMWHGSSHLGNTLNTILIIVWKHHTADGITLSPRPEQLSRSFTVVGSSLWNRLPPSSRATFLSFFYSFYVFISS